MSGICVILLIHAPSDLPSRLTSHVPLHILKLNACLLHPALETHLGPVLLPDLGPLHLTVPSWLGSWAQPANAYAPPRHPESPATNLMISTAICCWLPMD